MVEQAHQVSIVFEEVDGLIFLEQVSHYLAQQRTEFEGMARACGDYQHILVVICPVNQEIVTFDDSIVTCFNIFD